ncbi:MAG: D-aminoacylase [Pseudomonadota bacterium]|jgi:N-acyl-D-amino-acid deacylase
MRELLSLERWSLRARRGVVGLALLALCGLSSGQTGVPVAGQVVPGLEAFDAVMQATLAKHDYPGGTLAVAYQGRMVLNKAYGYAKRGLTGNVPMATDQRMRIASMSKWITGAAVLKAAEQGKLKLDQPLVDVLGWSQTPGDYVDPRAMKITVRHLVQNHAGWTIDRANDPMFERVPACPGSAERWVSRKKLDADPGHLYSYGNINFCLAQLALEKATGQAYADYVRTHIAQPLGISSWQLALARGSADEPEYTATQGADSNPYTQIDMEALGAAGAWTSSASDYVRFLSGLRGYRGKAVLAPEFLAQMIARPVAGDAAGKPVYYGLGANIRVLEGGGYNAWHHGSLAGTTSFGASYANGWTVFAVFNRRLPRETRDAATIEFDRAISQAIGRSGRPDGEISP